MQQLSTFNKAWLVDYWVRMSGLRRRDPATAQVIDCTNGSPGQT
jgi:hypothetical protein